MLPPDLRVLGAAVSCTNSLVCVVYPPRLSPPPILTPGSQFFCRTLGFKLLGDGLEGDPRHSYLAFSPFCCRLFSFKASAATL